MQIKHYDIFVPGGYPKYTYNPRVSLQIEQKLGASKHNLCKLVVVTGQTKSGKTVLAKKIFPPEEAVWIDGGSITEIEDFWEVVVEQLNLFDTRETESLEGNTNTLGAKLSGEASAGFAKIGSEVNTEHERVHESTTRASRTLSPQVVGVSGLRAKMRSVVIDDFHYIPKDVQGSIIRALKSLIFDGLPVVIIAIPHHRYEAVKVEKEMTGRFNNITIPTWEEPELTFIAETGFRLLNQSIATSIAKQMAAEAIGSPHLMQDFCRGICSIQGVVYSDRHTNLLISDENLKAVFREVAETIGRPIFEKLARGPKARSDRMQRELKTGAKCDIYQLVLHGLAHLRPGLISIEYEALRSAIREVSNGQPPQLHEVNRVLKHMATIAASDRSSPPVLDFDDEDKQLHITDPYFAFYLRWGQLAIRMED